MLQGAPAHPYGGSTVSVQQLASYKMTLQGFVRDSRLSYNRGWSYSPELLLSADNSTACTQKAAPSTLRTPSCVKNSLTF